MVAGIRSLLLADATTAALIGTAIDPVYAAANAALPYVTYQIVTSIDDPTLGVPGAVEVTQRLQFDIWSSTYSQGRAIEKAMGNVLRGFAGLLSDGCRVLTCQRENVIDSFPAANRQFHIVAEYLISFSES